MPEIVCRVIDCHVFRFEKNAPYYLLLKRSADVVYPGSWRMVGGKIEEGEKAWETATRELKEETGLSAQRLWSVPFVNQFYEAEKDRLNLIPVFAALVKDKSVSLSREHSEFKWCLVEEALELLPWPAQKQGLQLTHEYIVGSAEVAGFLEVNLNS